MPKTISELEDAYTQAGSNYRSALLALGNTADELHAFVALRYELREHPEFSGTLPPSFFSGSELDPDGEEPPLEDWAASSSNS